VDLVGSCDPYIVIYRVREDGNAVPVYKSEVGLGFRVVLTEHCIILQAHVGRVLVQPTPYQLL
jgi:hypothetical protein